MLEVRLLGPLEIRDLDITLQVHRRKPRALLAFLALNAGRVVSRDRLVDAIWGDEAPKTVFDSSSSSTQPRTRPTGLASATSASSLVLRLVSIRSVWGNQYMSA